MGRWNGKTFKEYISEQLSNFSEGMSAGGWTDVFDKTVAADYEPQLTDEES